MAQSGRGQKRLTWQPYYNNSWKREVCQVVQYRQQVRQKYIQRFGRLKPKICVLHKCDNPLCVTWSHIFLGTQRDNMIDRAMKEHNKLPNQRFQWSL